MAELKTKPTNASVADFLAGIKDDTRRKECQTVARMMRKATGKNAKMWGPSMVGYGKYRYKYATGREGEWFLTGFAPRKQSLTLYIMEGFKRYDALLAKLGTFKTGVSCLYVKSLDDVDLKVLERLINESVTHVAKANA